MSLLYLCLLALCGLVGAALRARSRALERKFTRVAQETDAVFKAVPLRQGNTSKSDPFLEARRAYELGRLAERRDAVEARYAAWQTGSERFDAFTARLRNWKGKYLPYLFGAADAALLLVAVDRLGSQPGAGTQTVVQTVSTLLGR